MMCRPAVRLALIGSFVMAAGLCSPCATAWAQEKTPAAEPRVDFARDVMPIFQARCISCHGPDEQEGQLRLDAKAIVMKGGISGALLTAGKGAESLLYHRVAGIGDGDRMPAGEDPLSDSQIALIRRWIDEGAVWPEGIGANVTSLKKHWAYIKPVHPALPKVADATSAKNAIDYFILARLEQEKQKLAPAPREPRAQLVRRVHLDLVGLPPTVEEVDAFLADERPDAYERLVDRLLSSSRYGERWAGPWLDLARYADSNGFQRDGHRTSWAYRDWVIDSLNADKPYDQFTIEQIAGDLLPDATAEQKIATGFHRCTTVNVEAGTDPEENRVNAVIDRVNTTGTVWLGTTIECAQCHNHKYDPFTQKDYYRLFAYFNNTLIETEEQGTARQFIGPTMPLPMSVEQAAQKRQLDAAIRQKEGELDALAKKLDAQQPAWEKQQSIVASASGAVRWQVLPIADFASDEGSGFEIRDDQSVLLVGDPADTDTYTVTVKTKLAGITGFRLEALTDPTLPGSGPGRGDPQRPNFVLNEIKVTASVAVAAGGASDEGVTQAVALHTARADFSQAKFAADGAIDNDLATAWAINPQFGKPHTLTFQTKTPLGDGSETTLTFKLVQNFGQARTIGRLRLSATTDAAPADGEGMAGGAPGNVRDILLTPAAKRNKKQSDELRDYFLSQQPDYMQLKDALQKFAAQADEFKPATTLVMVEQDAPRMTNILKRGNFLDPLDPVQPGTPEALHPLHEGPANRLSLAQWLVDRDNPLTARVAVNRAWAEFFGQGLVASLEDFGSQSEPCTHPQLLDYLAVEFMDSGWSMKTIHRLIVTSATYQQQSRVTPQMLERDPYNRLYARGPRFRLPAERIRDNALAIAGLLGTKMGGEPIRPVQPDGIWRVTGAVDNTYRTSTGEDQYRRGVYVVLRRSSPYPSFVTFDATDRGACTVKRARTNTPLQALTLMNDPVYVELAASLARRILTDRPAATDDERAQYAFRLCLARVPRTEELDLLVGIYRQAQQRYADDPAAAKAVLGKGPRPAGVTEAEAAAWLHLASVLLNLDETITKG